MKKIFLLIGILSLFLVGLVSAFNQTDSLGQDLLNAYKFDNNATNLIVSDNTTNYHLNSSSYTNIAIEGISGSAFNLSSTQYILNPFNSEIYEPNATINWWMKNTNNANGQVFMYMRELPTSGEDHFIYAPFSTNNKLFVSLNQGGPYIGEYYTSDYITSSKWTMITLVMDLSGCYFYVNGTQTDNNTGIDCSLNFPNIAEGGMLALGRHVTGGSAIQDQVPLDELYFWNRSLTELEVSSLYNSGTGLFLNYVEVQEAPINNPPIVKWNTTTLGYNNTAMNNNTIYFNFTYSDIENNSSNCSLLVNGTINQTLINFNSPTGNFNLNFSDEFYSKFTFEVSCNDNSIGKSGEIDLTIDKINPILTINYPINETISFYSSKYTMNLSTSDLNPYLLIVNCSFPNGSIIFQDTINLTGITSYNYLKNISLLQIAGQYNCLERSSDAHTKNKLDKLTGVSRDNILEFGYKKADYTLTILSSNYPLSNTYLENKINKYEFGWDFNNPEEKNNKVTIELKSGKKIVYLSKSKYNSHFIIDDYYYIDFEPYKAKVKMIDKNTYEITIDTTKNIKTQSTGELNIVTRTNYFIVDNPECLVDEDCNHDQDCINYICQDNILSFWTKWGDMLSENIGATFIVFLTLVISTILLVKYYND